MLDRRLGGGVGFWIPACAGRTEGAEWMLHSRLFGGVGFWIPAFAGRTEGSGGC